jgi:hypothetical protein
LEAYLKKNLNEGDFIEYKTLLNEDQS